MLAVAAPSAEPQVVAVARRGLGQSVREVGDVVTQHRAARRGRRVAVSADGQTAVGREQLADRRRRATCRVPEPRPRVRSSGQSASMMTSRCTGCGAAERGSRSTEQASAAAPSRLPTVRPSRRSGRRRSSGSGPTATATRAAARVDGRLGSPRRAVARRARSRTRDSSLAAPAAVVRRAGTLARIARACIAKKRAPGLCTWRPMCSAASARAGVRFLGLRPGERSGRSPPALPAPGRRGCGTAGTTSARAAVGEGHRLRSPPADRSPSSSDAMARPTGRRRRRSASRTRRASPGPGLLPGERSDAAPPCRRPNRRRALALAYLASSGVAGARHASQHGRDRQSEMGRGARGWRRSPGGRARPRAAGRARSLSGDQGRRRAGGESRLPGSSLSIGFEQREGIAPLAWRSRPNQPPVVRRHRVEPGREAMRSLAARLAQGRSPRQSRSASW
mgnify:CR=1 FL=1